jgi:uncharacterized membrane protein HdeD (DUF308 family)
MRRTSARKGGREEEQRANPATLAWNLILLVIIVVIAYLLAGLVIDRFDLYDRLDLGSVTIPGIDAPVPDWALQLVLTIVLFFLFQPIVVIAMDLVKPKRLEDEIDKTYNEPWQR